MAMENHQSEEQQSSQLSDLKPAPSSGREARPVASNSLAKIVKNRPWLVWAGMSALLLATIVGALLSLMSMGHVEREEPKRTTTPTQPAATASQTSRSLPLWLLGAIILCCAGGSLAIARQLNRPSLPRKLRKRMRHASARVLPHRHRQKRRSGRRPQVADPQNHYHLSSQRSLKQSLW